MQHGQPQHPHAFEAPTQGSTALAWPSFADGLEPQHAHHAPVHHLPPAPPPQAQPPAPQGQPQHQGYQQPPLPPGWPAHPESQQHAAHHQPQPQHHPGPHYAAPAPQHPHQAFPQQQGWQQPAPHGHYPPQGHAPAQYPQHPQHPGWAAPQGAMPQHPGMTAPQTYAFADSPAMVAGGGPALAGHAAPMPGHDPAAGYFTGGGAPAPQGYGPDLSTYAFPTIGGQQVLNAPGSRVVGYRSRTRWENIVPMLALVACIATGILVIVQWDDILKGRSGGAEPAKVAKEPAADKEPAKEPAEGSAMTPGTGEAETEVAKPDAAAIEAAITDATAAFEKGAYAEAQAVLHPLLEAGVEDPRVEQLHVQVDDAAAKYGDLVALSQKHMGEQKWQLALNDFAAIAKLRPLTPRQAALKERAGQRLAEKVAAKKRAAAAAARAKREQQQANARPSTNSPVGGGGPTMRPPTGRPPAGNAPPRPGAANPSGSGSVAGPQPGVVTGGGAMTHAPGTNCHSHGGISECH